MDLKKQYEELRKKHKTLPSYEELNNEYELLYFSELIKIDFPLRFIRRRINDKLAGFIGLLQSILQPNPGSLLNLEESKFFDEDEKKKIAYLTKELMKIDRENILLNLNLDEKKDTEFIINTHKKWLKLKKEILKYVQKLKTNWEKEFEKTTPEHYFG